jgi:hypothetical protein
MNMGAYEDAMRLSKGQPITEESIAKMIESMKDVPREDLYEASDKAYKSTMKRVAEMMDIFSEADLLFAVKELTINYMDFMQSVVANEASCQVMARLLAALFMTEMESRKVKMRENENIKSRS